LIVFDELKYAEELLINGYKDMKYISYDNIILVKYWKYKGLSEDEIKVKLIDFMNMFQNLFNDNIINYKVHKAITIGMQYELEFNKKVDIYQSELEIINSFENIEIKKILFVLLVVWKNKNKHKFRISNSDILKLSEVKCNNDKFWNYLHEIFPTGYMILSEYRNKAYYKIDMLEQGDITFSIDSYDNVIDYYLSTLYPEKYKNCESCGRPTKITNNKKKYCKKCARIIKLENDRKVQKERYKKLKFSQKENNVAH
jgi:hypothetical protein